MAELKSGYMYLWRWAYGPPAVYPEGQVAEFSFRAAGVRVINATDAMIGVLQYTAEGNQYVVDSVILNGPAAPGPLNIAHVLLLLD